MTEKEIFATEEVLMVNADISALYEKRGVPRADMREVFRLARVGLELSDPKRAEKALKDLIYALVDEAGADIHEKEDCPQDDTCDCVMAQRVNEALKGWDP